MWRTLETEFVAEIKEKWIYNSGSFYPYTAYKINPHTQMLPFKFLTLNDKKIINIFNCTLDFDSDGITLQFFFYKFIFSSM